MNSFKLLKRIASIAAGLVLVGTAAFAQPNTDVAVTVTNGASVKNLAFGINTAATEAIDLPLGEQSLPPFPPSGVYEARFINFDGTSIGQGSPKNYRPSPQVGTKSYRVKWQPATGTPQILVEWNSAAVAAAYGTATITPQGGAAVNMLTTGSITIADGENDATYATIAVSGPIAPPQPLNITSSCPNDYGTLNLPTGGTVGATHQFTLTNTTGSPITVSSITSSDANFTIGSFPASIPPGTTNFDVVFSTNVVGPDNATITVTHSAGTPLTCDAIVNVVSGEGLYWKSITNSFFDNSTGMYANDIGLQYSGATPLNGIQFVISIPNRTLLVDNVVIGNDVPSPANWEFLYRVIRTASASEVRVVMYARDGVTNLPAGDYDELVKVMWNVVDIDECNGGAGGDTRAATAVLSDVESSLFGDIGADGGVDVDANRDVADFTVVNRSARGDVNCDDLVDVMDVLDVNDNVLGLLPFAGWQTNRADLAPWSSYWATPGATFDDANNYGNLTVNVGDLTLLVNAILNENWPDMLPLGRTRAQANDPSNTIAANSIYDVKLTYDISSTGVKVAMENLAPVKGIQMKIKASEAPQGLQAMISEQIGVPMSVTTLVKDGEVRLIAITANGQPIAPSNGSLLDLAFAISDPNTIVVVEPITIGGADNRPLVVEYEVNSSVSGIELEQIVTGLETVPNPFSGSTEIRFALDRQANVSIVVTNAAGNIVRELLSNETRAAGNNAVKFDAGDLASGTYYATISVDGASHTQKLVVGR